MPRGDVKMVDLMVEVNGLNILRSQPEAFAEDVLASCVQTTSPARLRWAISNSPWEIRQLSLASSQTPKQVAESTFLAQSNSSSGKVSEQIVSPMATKQCSATMTADLLFSLVVPAAARRMHQ